MVFIGGILKPVQDMYKQLAAIKEKKEPPSVEAIDKLMELAKKTAAVIHKRTFVVMTAQNFGWGFAKELDFYQNSKLFIIAYYFFFLNLLVYGYFLSIF